MVNGNLLVAYRRDNIERRHAAGSVQYTCKGVLFAVTCDQPEIVPVPISRGKTELQTARDLEVQEWLYPWGIYVVDLTDNIVLVGDLDTSDKFYVAHTFSRTDSQDSPNDLLQNLSDDPSLTFKGGNVLVLKANGEGQVVDATARDIAGATRAVMRVAKSLAANGDQAEVYYAPEHLAENLE